MTNETTVAAPAPLNVSQLPAELLATLRHMDATPSDWQPPFADTWDGVADTSEEGGLK